MSIGGAEASGYEVQVHQYGILVKGRVPVDEFSVLLKIWEKQGHDTLDIGVSSALGATFAVCSEENGKKWREAISGKAQVTSKGDPELEWLNGTDTGLSSRTIFSVLSKEHGRYAIKGGWWPTTPSDPSDFGRCFRLLQAVPGWRARLSEVAARYTDWSVLVREWDKMEALWLEEAPTGECPKLYIFMEELHAELQDSKGNHDVANQIRKNAQYMREHPISPKKKRKLK